jgi:hypothetical protein
MDQVEAQLVTDLVRRFADPREAQDALSDAGMLLEKYQFRREGTEIHGSMGWSDFVVATNLSHDGANALAGALRLVIETGDDDAVASALSCLAVLRESRFHELFCSILRDHLDRDPRILHQSLVALDRLGANLSWGASRSISAVAENRRVAQAYLATLGGGSLLP